MSSFLKSIYGSAILHRMFQLQGQSNRFQWNPSTEIRSDIKSPKDTLFLDGQPIV